MSEKQEIKNLSLRVEKDLHKKLKLKLLQEEKTFQDWAIEKIEEYVEEGEQK